MLVDKEINLYQLDQELNGMGLNATHGEDGKIIEVFLADNNTATEDELRSVVEAHVAINEENVKAAAKESAVAKLFALGLTEDEIKALVGA
jgi:predicted DNA binding protein